MAAFKTKSTSQPRSPYPKCSVSIWVLILSNLLVFQLTASWLTADFSSLFGGAASNSDDGDNDDDDEGINLMDIPAHFDTRRGASQEGKDWNPLNPLAIPPGQAKNLPSIRNDDENTDKKADKVEKKRQFYTYGGKGDQKHLGGFTELDIEGISPTVWTNMIQQYGVHSLLDVGCGRGISTRWFLEHGADVLCVEGSHDAVLQSYLPPEKIVEHDFSRGPWWPGKTYDAAWSVEFLEHVSRQYHFNYIQAFRKAALIFVTSSRWGGWHHVEIHPDDWWIRKFESYGFRYDAALTKQVIQWAASERTNRTMPLAPNGKPFRAAHITNSMKVFVNPVVAALPQHAHLFPRDGCFKQYDKKKGAAFRSETQPCGIDKRRGFLETTLPDSYLPLKVTPAMHQKWHDAIRKGLNQTTTTTTTTTTKSSTTGH